MFFLFAYLPTGIAKTSLAQCPLPKLNSGENFQLMKRNAHIIIGKRNTHCQFSFLCTPKDIKAKPPTTHNVIAENLLLNGKLATNTQIAAHSSPLKKFDTLFDAIC
jgi:hypothetical protein